MIRHWSTMLSDNWFYSLWEHLRDVFVMTCRNFTNDSCSWMCGCSVPDDDGICSKVAVSPLQPVTVALGCVNRCPGTVFALRGRCSQNALSASRRRLAATQWSAARSAIALDLALSTLTSAATPWTDSAGEKKTLADYLTSLLRWKTNVRPSIITSVNHYFIL